MSEKILKVTSPFLSVYPDYGMLFSILGNEEKDWEWIYCNFIQLEVRYNKPLDYYFTCLKGHNDFLVECPSLVHHKVPEKMICDLFHNSFTKFIMFCLDSDMYFYCLMDYSKIERIKSNRIHNCFFLWVQRRGENILCK